MNAPLIHPFARAGNSSQLLLPVLYRAPLGNLSRNVCVYTGPKVTRGGRKAATPGRCIPSFLSGERRRTNEPSFAKGGGRLRRLVVVRSLRCASRARGCTESRSPRGDTGTRVPAWPPRYVYAWYVGVYTRDAYLALASTVGIRIAARRESRPALPNALASLARVLREFGSELSRIRGLCWRHISNCGEISRNRYQRAEYVNRAEYFVW